MEAPDPTEPEPEPEPKPRGKWRRRLGLLGLAGLLGVGCLWMDAGAATGAAAMGSRRDRMELSPQWHDGRFVDTLPRVEPDVFTAVLRFVQGTDNGSPSQPVPIVMRGADEFDEPPQNGLRVTWFGHSSLLVEIDGHRILADPVWGQRCSPFTFLGPARFHPPPMALADLPPLDAVVISHDHYDHLDHPTVVELRDRAVPFVVPLGVGAHLEHWGVDPEHIVELDWWEDTVVGSLTLTATPARHFSGRSVLMTDRDQTLWSGWAIAGPEHSAYYSGDSAMFPGFAEIGSRLGPFDVTMIESGAYNQLWADVHLGPEQAVQAHLAVRGNLMIPVHWGTFDLALHPWTEPAERVMVAAAAAGVAVATPRPGQSIYPDAAPTAQRWWPQIPWQTAKQAPVVSSGLTAAAP